MNEEELLSKLRSFSLEQLTQIQQHIELKAKQIKLERRQKAEAIKREQDIRKNSAAVKTAPRSSRDIEQLADQMGLDLSSLMREISRR